MSADSGATPSAPPTKSRWLWVVRTAVFLWLLALTVWLFRGAPQELVVVAITFAGILVGLFTKGRRRALAWAFGAGTVIFVASAGVTLVLAGEAKQGGLTVSPSWLTALAWAFGGAALAVSALIAFYALGREKGDLHKLVEGLLLPLILLVTVILARMNPCTKTVLHANEISANASVRTINSAEASYADEYQMGFSPNLAALAPPFTGAKLSASAAGLIPIDLAGGVHNGYRFTYTPGPPDKAGHIQTYILTARPSEFGKSGRKNFSTDQSGVIHESSEDRPATAKDPPLAG